MGLSLLFCHTSEAKKASIGIAMNKIRSWFIYIFFIQVLQKGNNQIHKKLKECCNMKYICDACGYVYDPAVGDPDNGIAPGTNFEDLPDSWTCPMCGVGKDMFSPE